MNGSLQRLMHKKTESLEGVKESEYSRAGK
jgi:hypothetical protein